MIPLYDYISPNKNIKVLSDDEKKYLLELDKEYGDFFREFWVKWNRTDVVNFKDEYDKFLDGIKNKTPYYPQIKLVKDELTEEYLKKALILRNKFVNFNCYLSKFYIENIDYLYIQAMWTIKRDQASLNMYNKLMCPKPSEENYQAAWDMIKKHPYKDVKEEQIYKGKDIVDKMQAHIDKLGYKYKVVLDKYMVARQNVVPHEPVLNIKTDADFSDIDVASLKVHEVEVHVARRYYGMMTGLNLFVDGLAFRNTTDEGMAIYQSINKNPLGVKPNLFFDIAIKTIIGYHIMDMDFYELYKYLKKRLKNTPGLVIFKNLIRFKRTVQDCRILGGDSISETDYLCGYMLVKDMTSKERRELIKWNVGPNHIKDIPDIKKFFKLNKFKPICIGDEK